MLPAHLAGLIIPALSVQLGSLPFASARPAAVRQRRRRRDLFPTAYVIAAHRSPLVVGPVARRSILHATMLLMDLVVFLLYFPSRFQFLGSNPILLC